MEEVDSCSNARRGFPRTSGKALTTSSTPGRPRGRRQALPPPTRTASAPRSPIPSRPLRVPQTLRRRRPAKTQRHRRQPPKKNMAAARVAVPESKTWRRRRRRFFPPARKRKKTRNAPAGNKKRTGVRRRRSPFHRRFIRSLRSALPVRSLTAGGTSCAA